MSFDQYSETPASNYITGYFLTGMAPSSVKVAGSDIMADLASRFAAMHTTGGTATAYTVTQTRQFQSLVNGLEIIVLPNATNTGAATFAPDGLAAKNIFTNGVAAIAGMIVQNVPAYLKYDGTQWNLLNPQRATGSFTITLTGMTGTTTGTINYDIKPDGKTWSAWAAAAITGTSNSSAMTGTGIPAILTNTTDKEYYCPLVNGGGTAQGGIRTGTSTTWTFCMNSSGAIGPTNFGSSGSKGISQRFAFVSSID